jgi:transcriptional regulator with XRE-family HTH domain
MNTQFGAALKDWRGRRRMSQLDLGLAANVSARHVAFLEIGRSRPSRSMVVQLSEALAIPHGARNLLLNAAGFTSAYRQRDLDLDEMSHVREAVDWILDRHDPYPAIVVDRHWRLVLLNHAASALFGAVGVRRGDSLLQALTTSPRLRDAILNWPEVARHMVVRLRTESAHLGGDPVLEAAADQLALEVGPGLLDDAAPLPAVTLSRFAAGGMTLSLFSTIAQFGTAEDIALAELRIEMMFPADPESRDLLITTFAKGADQEAAGPA